MSAQAVEQECWCEHVDIGVGMQKVAEHPECPRCTGGPRDHQRELEQENQRLAALVSAATEFTFLPDLAEPDFDPAEFAVRICRGDSGRWYLTRGNAPQRSDSLYDGFWDCAKQRFKTSRGLSAVDRIFYGFDSVDLIIELQLPAALAAQAQYATHGAARR